MFILPILFCSELSTLLTITVTTKTNRGQSFPLASLYSRSTSIPGPHEAIYYQPVALVFKDKSHAILEHGLYYRQTFVQFYTNKLSFIFLLQPHVSDLYENCSIITQSIHSYIWIRTDLPRNGFIHCNHLFPKCDSYIRPALVHQHGDRNKFVTKKRKEFLHFDVLFCLSLNSFLNVCECYMYLCNSLQSLVLKFHFSFQASYTSFKFDSNIS